jgi:hypothetical protein
VLIKYFSVVSWITMSEYSKHILSKGHTYGIITDTIDIIKQTKNT